MKGNPNNSNQFEEDKNENSNNQNPFNKNEDNSSISKTEISLPRFISENIQNLSNKDHFHGYLIRKNPIQYSNNESMKEDSNQEKYGPEEIKIDNSNYCPPSFNNSIIPSNPIRKTWNLGYYYNPNTSWNDNFDKNLNYLNQRKLSQIIETEGKYPNTGDFKDVYQYGISNISKGGFLRKQGDRNGFSKNFDQNIIKKPQSFEFLSGKESFKEEKYSEISREGYSESKNKIQNPSLSKIANIVKQDLIYTYSPYSNSNFSNKFHTPGKIIKNSFQQISQDSPNPYEINQYHENNLINNQFNPSFNYVDKREAKGKIIKNIPYNFIEQKIPDRNIKKYP